MRPYLFILYILILVCISSCEKKQDNEPISHDTLAQGSQQDQPIIQKMEPIAVNTEFKLEEKQEVFRTTAYDSRLLSDPNANTELIKIPKGTRLKVMDDRMVQQGRLNNHWYQVQFKGKTGWVSGWNMEEKEELIVTSVEEMEANYETEIGEKPKNNGLTGEVDVVRDFIDKRFSGKSITIEQWYLPFYFDKYWNCRVQYKVDNQYYDDNYRVKKGKVMDYKDWSTKK